MELKKQVIIKWYQRTLYNFYKEMDYKFKWIKQFNQNIYIVAE